VRGKDGASLRITFGFVSLIGRKITVDAGTHADRRLLKSSFKAWHGDTLATRLEKSIDQRCLQKHFTHWTVRQRGILLSRVRDQRFLEEAFEIWKERIEGIQTVLDSTLEVAESGRNLRILGHSFSEWRKNLTMRNNEVELATVSPPCNYS
jgi:hypothetical protein